jgi:purine-binding chemotaxis protein CheW
LKQNWQGLFDMQQLFLIAEIAGTEVAICSDVIESVVTVGDAVNVPKADPVIAGLFALRSRVLTLIDCQYRVTGQKAAAEKGSLAVIAAIGGHNFGLIVDRVRDVVGVDDNALKPAVKLEKRWSEIVSGLAEIDGKLLMVIDPERLVAVDTRLAA